MEGMSLTMKYDEHIRHVLTILDTTVERGNKRIYIYLDLPNFTNFIFVFIRL